MLLAAPIITGAKNVLSGICAIFNTTMQIQNFQQPEIWFRQAVSTTRCALIIQSCSVITIIRVSTGHVAYICAYIWHNAHPWQLAHSSSNIETSSTTVRVLRVTTTTSCPLPSHDATPVAAAAPDPTTPASGPHHTPLSTGAMMHHTGEDIWQVPAGETRNAQRQLSFVISSFCAGWESNKHNQIICKQWVSSCNYFFFGDTLTALSKWIMWHTYITLRVEESACFYFSSLLVGDKYFIYWRIKPDTPCQLPLLCQANTLDWIDWDSAAPWNHAEMLKWCLCSLIVIWKEGLILLSLGLFTAA